MSKPVLPFVEIMATQACNISCTGCTNYSDIAHKGWVSWNDAAAQIVPWLERVEILDFGIMGGEPLLNPEIKDWIIGLRKLLPDTQIRFTTNGLLLDQHLDLIDLVAEVGNIVFKISVHVRNESLEKTIGYIFDRYNWQPVTEYGIKRFTTGNRFRFQINRADIFWKTFQGNYTDMRPHDSDPAEAFSICCQKTCPLLYQGQLYKCSTSGLLRDVLQRFGRLDHKLWQPFLVSGLDPTCDSEQLNQFINNFGKFHAICGQCPTKKNTESAITHLQNVHFKKIKS
jgi:sulfatase maturation enzyme AslB (radical SAM superfamily)